MSAPTSSPSAPRLDAFVDAAFAFCMTLLVVAGGDLPQTLGDLKDALARIPAFAVGFALLALFWWSHYTFRRAYAGHGAMSVVLSLCLVFVVMIYVYPLRLLGESTAYYLSGQTLPGSELVRSYADMKFLYVIYGLGFVALATINVLLFRLAVRQPAGDAGLADAKDSLSAWAIAGSVGLFSILLGALLPASPWAASLPGLSYMLIPVLIGLWFGFGPKFRKRRPASS